MLSGRVEASIMSRFTPEEARAITASARATVARLRTQQKPAPPRMQQRSEIIRKDGPGLADDDEAAMSSAVAECFPDTPNLCP